MRLHKYELLTRTTLAKHLCESRKVVLSTQGPGCCCQYTLTLGRAGVRKGASQLLKHCLLVETVFLLKLFCATSFPPPWASLFPSLAWESRRISSLSQYILPERDCSCLACFVSTTPGSANLRIPEWGKDKPNVFCGKERGLEVTRVCWSSQNSF